MLCIRRGSTLASLPVEADSRTATATAATLAPPKRWHLGRRWNRCRSRLNKWTWIGLKTVEKKCTRKRITNPEKRRYGSSWPRNASHLRVGDSGYGCNAKSWRIRTAETVPAGQIQDHQGAKATAQIKQAKRAEASTHIFPTESHTGLEAERTGRTASRSDGRKKCDLDPCWLLGCCAGALHSF